MSSLKLRQSVSSADRVHPFDLSDRGLLLGDGVFDTSLVVNGQIILWEYHRQRLLSACDVFGLTVCGAELDALAADVIPADTTGALRLTVTRGPGARGLAGDTALEPTLLASFSPQSFSFPARPVRLEVSAIQRNTTAPSARHKTLSYTDAIMGQKRAQAAGFDDALYITPDAHVACSSIANIFARYGDLLVTPPPHDGVVEGVMRKWVLENAVHAGFTTSEDSLHLEDLKIADAVFLTNSLRLLVPVSMIDETVFSPVLPKSLSAQVNRFLSSAVRMTQTHPDSTSG